MASCSNLIMSKIMVMAVMVGFLLMLMMGPSSSELKIPRCRTNKHSPSLVDAQKCVEHVRNRSKCCRLQQPPEPTVNCSLLAKVGSAEALVCGRRPGSCVSCTTAANALHALVNTCGRNVNGTRRISGSDELSGFTFRIRPSRRPSPVDASEIDEDDDMQPELVDNDSEPSGEDAELVDEDDNSELVEEELPDEELGEKELPPFVSIISAALE